MARGTITDLDTVKGWKPNKDFGIADEATLNRCLLAASAAIESLTSRRFAADDYTEQCSGSAACWHQDFDQTALYLRWFPIVSVTLVSESGISLPVVNQSSPANPTDCVLVGKDEGILLRAVSRPNSSGFDLLPWDDGFGNVLVRYRAGYETDDMPQEIVQACCELTWLMYHGKARVGVTVTAKGGKSASWTTKLSEDAREAIDNASRPLRPCSAMGF